jgi:hypothetical protein
MFRHTCQNCGRFVISGLKSTTLPKQIEQTPKLRMNLPLHIREANKQDKTPELDEFFLDDALQREPDGAHE